MEFSNLAAQYVMQCGLQLPCSDRWTPPGCLVRVDIRGDDLAPSIVGEAGNPVDGSICASGIHVSLVGVQRTNVVRLSEIILRDDHED